MAILKGEIGSLYFGNTEVWCEKTGLSEEIGLRGKNMQSLSQEVDLS